MFKIYFGPAADGSSMASLHCSILPQNEQKKRVARAAEGQRGFSNLITGIVRQTTGEPLAVRSLDMGWLEATHCIIGVMIIHCQKYQR